MSSESSRRDVFQRRLFVAPVALFHLCEISSMENLPRDGVCFSPSCTVYRTGRKYNQCLYTNINTKRLLYFRPEYLVYGIYVAPPQQQHQVGLLCFRVADAVRSGHSFRRVFLLRFPGGYGACSRDCGTPAAVHVSGDGREHRTTQKQALFRGYTGPMADEKRTW